MKEPRILSIESAIAGGSLALLSGSEVLEHWHSLEKVSRSENLLPQISILLESSGTELSSLTQIAVSNGPGSYTGIRIGLATAMGLARSLNIPCVGISLLNAMAEGVDGSSSVTAVLPIGRDGYSWQEFFPPKAETPGPVSGKIHDFQEFMSDRPETTILAQSDAYVALKNDGRGMPSVELVDIGRDLAIAVGHMSRRSDHGILPYYAGDR